MVNVSKTETLTFPDGRTMSILEIMVESVVLDGMVDPTALVNLSYDLFIQKGPTETVTMLGKQYTARDLCVAALTRDPNLSSTATIALVQGIVTPHPPTDTVTLNDGRILTYDDLLLTAKKTIYGNA
eukprot:PhF_6_TR7345/c0_g2_i1/m.11041